MNRKLATLPKISRQLGGRIESTIVFIITSALTAWTAIGALKIQLYTLGMLMFAAMFMLFFAVQEKPYHLTKPHRYAMDDIRVPVLSPTDSPMVYILPSPKYGFDAAFCQKLEVEQNVFESNRQLIEPAYIVKKDWSLEKCRAALYNIMASQVAKIEDHRKMIQDLGYWLYRRGLNEADTNVETDPLGCTLWRMIMRIATGSNRTNMKRTACKKRDSFTLIGRDIALALLFWEYLVFERRWELDDNKDQDPIPTKERTVSPNKAGALRDEVWRLRSRKHTGISPTDKLEQANIPQQNSSHPEPSTFGSAFRLDGFFEAVYEVYRLIDDPEFEHVRSRDGSTIPNGGDIEQGLTQLSNSQICECGQAAVRKLLCDLDEARKQGASVLPERSVVDGLTQLVSVDDYAGRLWEACWCECPNTFGALYLWTTVWYIDIGNIGFHTTPLVPQGDINNWMFDGPDYMTVWRIRWRHRWHSAILCQLVVLLPTVISGFLSLIAIT
ncbi:hypothetical protein GQ53DRAFT_819305 [Thozetella sp. PMI_491]|nr:hypothetical protein GQ53DRAFT_819305 [Thozetella sp. PMI_491]